MNTNPRKTPRASTFMRGIYPIILHSGMTELRSVRSLVNRLPAFLRDEQSDFEMRLNTIALEQEMDEEQRKGLFEHHEEDFHELHNFFPSAVWSSQLTLACSLFEATLMNACKILNCQLWRDAKGHGIERSAYFLRKNFGIYPEKNKAWYVVNDFFAIRHCFVHANGEVELMKDSQKIKASVNRLISAKVTMNEGTLKLEYSSVTAATEAMEAWLKDFWDSCANDEAIGPKYWP